ncbi:MAG: MBL fold metallo-hydrolase [Lachnospiraceae bacterium]|nr:MBL fold metallo-hydrolase [Lachnospiraceae bacterium]
MKTVLTIIVDNTPDFGIPGEWGLAIGVEYNGKRILVDAGASTLFLKNMKALGIDVTDFDYGVLSHAHYDHANGIPAFFQHNAKAKFYVREGSAPNCYHKKFIFRKYIGIPRRMLRDYPDRIEMVSGDYQLMDGAYLIPHKTEGLDAIGRRESMYRKTPLGWIPDDFSHEQSLVLNTDRGLVIINCCSHGGAANIIREVKETFPDKHVYGIIGGFHLFNKTKEEVYAMANKIKETGIEYVCTGHCTKERAFTMLKEELGDRLEVMKVGKTIEL